MIFIVSRQPLVAKRTWSVVMEGKYSHLSYTLLFTPSMLRSSLCSPTFLFLSQTSADHNYTYPFPLYVAMLDLPASPSYINTTNNSNNNNNNNNDQSTEGDSSNQNDEENDGEEEEEKNNKISSSQLPGQAQHVHSHQEQENQNTGGQSIFSPLKKRGKPTPQSPTPTTIITSNNNDNDKNVVLSGMVVASAKEVSKEVVEQGQGLEGKQSLRRARLVNGGGSLANL